MTNTPLVVARHLGSFKSGQMRLKVLFEQFVSGRLTLDGYVPGGAQLCHDELALTHPGILGNLGLLIGEERDFDGGGHVAVCKEGEVGFTAHVGMRDLDAEDVAQDPGSEHFLRLNRVGHHPIVQPGVNRDHFDASSDSASSEVSGSSDRPLRPDLPSSGRLGGETMTLLFTYVDDNYVMQVSDERISVWNPTVRKWEVRDDETAKQILIRGSLIASFTGVADIDGGVTTTEWLARRFADDQRDLEEVVASIADRLTSVFTRSRYKGQVLVVLIAGWIERPDRSLEPFFGHISNQHPTTYERLDAFDHLVGTLPSGAHWVSRGQKLPAGIDQELRRNIQAALPAGVSPPVMQRLFLNAMRATASNNRFVGPSALIGVLPRAAVIRGQQNPDDFWIFTNDQAAVIPGAPMFVRVPAGTDRTEPVRPFQA